MTELTSQNLYDIANGSTLLASGGGGSIKTAYGFIKEIIEQEKPVRLLKINELDKAEWGCVVGAMGSPKSFAEIGLNGAETRALEVLEKTKDKNFSFVVCVETGSNIFVAMLSAVKQQSSTGIVDGDGAGRSVPTLSCLSFSKSIPACPFALLNAAKNSENAVDNCGMAKSKRYPEEILINIKDKAPIDQAASVEETARPILGTPESFDGIAGISGWSMDAETAEQSLVLDTISNSQYLGEVLRESSQSPQNELTQEQIASIAEQLGTPYFLFGNHRACTIEDIKPINTGGFDYHLLTFTQSDPLQTIYVINQNENLIAWNANLPHPIAMGPDLICMVGKVNDQIKTDILGNLPDSEKDQASASLNGLHGLSVEDIKKKQSLYLFGLKANNRLREQPTADIFHKLLIQFGYLGPYVPIEDLSNKS